MIVQMDYKIDIKVMESNKLKEELTIFLREFTQAEKKENDSLKKKFEKIFKKVQKIGKKQKTLEKKVELYERNGDFEKSLEMLDEKTTLENELEELYDELDEIGGGDNEAFAEQAAKKRFETLVSGKDVDKLEAYAEIKGYVEIMHNLDVAKAELEKKQSGE